MKITVKSIIVISVVMCFGLSALAETETTPPTIGQKPDPYATQLNNWSNWSALNQMYMQKAIEEDAMRRAQENQAAEREALRKAAEEAEAKRTPEQKKADCTNKNVDAFKSCSNGAFNAHKSESNGCNYYYYGATASSVAGLGAAAFSFGGTAAVGAVGAATLGTKGYVCQQDADRVKDQRLMNCQVDFDRQQLAVCDQIK